VPKIAFLALESLGI